MRFNGNIIGVDNRASVGNTRGLWTLPPQSVARRESRWSVFDQDAAAYIAEVEAADQQPLEIEVKDAIHKFVIGCKDDNIWADIKACAILCGARTLTGALKPLVGAAPTNNNFVSGDYARATGLKGDVSTTTLNSNRNNNTDGQDDQHMAVYLTEGSSGSTAYIGAGVGDAGATHILRSVFRNRNSFNDNATPVLLTAPGLIGMSRNNAANFDVIHANFAQNITRASQSPFSGDIYVFARGAATSVTDARLAFYSIGEATNLALLSKNADRLVGAIQGALL